MPRLRHRLLLCPLPRVRPPKRGRPRPRLRQVASISSGNSRVSRVTTTRAACPARRKPAETGSAGLPRESRASTRHPKARPVDPPKQTVDAEDDERGENNGKREQSSLTTAAA